MVPFTFQVSAQQCGSTGTSTFPDLQNFYVGVTTMAVNGSGGTDDVENWEDAVPSGQAQGCICGPDSAGQQAAQEFRGDAVDTATGEYTDSFTDTRLNGPGYPLAVTRNHSSGVTAPGPLGPGWTVPWFASLAVDPSTGHVTFNSEDGNQYLYQNDYDGSYQPPEGVRSVLARTSSGSTLTTPQRDVLTFTSAGQLTSGDDPAGRGLSFSCTGGQLTGVTDAAGQSLTLSWTGGLLTGISLPGGQAITYGYTGGLLTSVTDPGERTAGYAYDSAGLLRVPEQPADPATQALARACSCPPARWAADRPGERPGCCAAGDSSRDPRQSTVFLPPGLLDA